MGLGDRIKLCIVSCHSCHVYVTWSSKEVGGDILKSLSGVAIHKGGTIFYGKVLTM